MEILLHHLVPCDTPAWGHQCGDSVEMKFIYRLTQHFLSLCLNFNTEHPNTGSDSQTTITQRREHCELQTNASRTLDKEIMATGMGLRHTVYKDVISCHFTEINP